MKDVIVVLKLLGQLVNSVDAVPEISGPTSYSHVNAQDLACSSHVQRQGRPSD
jgi:hypothetical protein